MGKLDRCLNLDTYPTVQISGPALSKPAIDRVGCLPFIVAYAVVVVLQVRLQFRPRWTYGVASVNRVTERGAVCSL